MAKKHARKMAAKYMPICAEILRYGTTRRIANWAHINAHVQKHSPNVVAHSVIDVCIEHLCATGECTRLPVAGEVYRFGPPTA